MPDLTRPADDGRPDPRLAAALERWGQAPGRAARAEVLAALSDARLFLALAARALETEVGAAGLVQERTTDLAVLSVVRPADGARAVVAFADGHAVPRWRAEARPLPMPARDACRDALEDGATAVLLDPLGASFVVAAPELAALADGRVPVPGAAVSTRRTAATLTTPTAPPDPALLAALAAALEREPVTAARLLEGPDGPVLGVVPAGGTGAAELAALADRVAQRLRPLLPAVGLDLAAVPPDGPGVPVPLRGARRRLGLLRRSPAAGDPRRTGDTGA